MPELRSISFEVDGKKILNNISLTVKDNRFTIITGPNGGGKSTLAKLIMGIEKPAEGEILFDGEGIMTTSIDEQAKRRIGYAFQQPPRFKGMSVCKPLSLAHGKNLDEEICRSYLTDVGLCSKDYLNRNVDASLSGGKVKRAEIAGILTRDLKLSIFDEPGAGVDLWNFAKLVEALQKLQRESRQSAILISHQERVARLADEIIIIGDGTIKTKGKRDDIPPSLMNKFDSCEFEKQVRQVEQMEKNLLKTVADIGGFMLDSIFSLRKNRTGAERYSTEHTKIPAKIDKPGIDIIMDGNTVGGSIHIPIILIDGGIQDMVYNDLYIGEGADVETVAGCDIHNGGCDTPQHNGTHTFHIGRSASTTYAEKHYGEGSGSRDRILNPTTVVHMEEDSFAKVDISQIRGVDSTFRKTEANLGATAKPVINEKLMTHVERKAHLDMTVNLDGGDSVVQIISRSVGKDTSVQVFHPVVAGNDRFRAHIQCDSIIMGKAKISSTPRIAANHMDAEIIHEAAIGKINNNQLIKLQTFGLNSEEAEKVIVGGFLR